MAYGGAEAGHSYSDLDREREWHMRQFPNMTSPHNDSGRDTTAVVVIEAPTTSSTATGAGHRRARDTPLAKELPLRVRATAKDLGHYETRKRDPEQLHNTVCYCPHNKP